MASAAAAKEMPASVPLLRSFGPTSRNQASCTSAVGCKRMPRRFLGHLVRREPAKFLINERKQFIRRLRVTMFDGLENSGDITHAKWATRVGYALELENPRTKLLSAATGFRTTCRSLPRPKVWLISARRQRPGFRTQQISSRLKALIHISLLCKVMTLPPCGLCEAGELLYYLQN